MSDVSGRVAVLRQVQERFPGSAAATTATAELKRMRPAVSKSAAAKLEEGVENLDMAERSRLIEEAIALDPSSDDAQIALAHHLGTSGSWPQFESQLKVLQRKGLLESALRSRRIEAGPWASHPGWRGLLTDVWGPAKVDFGAGRRGQ